MVRRVLCMALVAGSLVGCATLKSMVGLGGKGQAGEAASGTAASASGTVAASVDAGAALANLDAWQKIKASPDMTTKNVEALLGKPVRVITINDTMCTWYYEGEVAGKGMLTGNIFFMKGKALMVTLPEAKK